MYASSRPDGIVRIFYCCLHIFIGKLYNIVSFSSSLCNYLFWKLCFHKEIKCSLQRTLDIRGKGNFGLSILFKFSIFHIFPKCGTKCSTAKVTGEISLMFRMLRLYCRETLLYYWAKSLCEIVNWYIGIGIEAQHMNTNMRTRPTLVVVSNLQVMHTSNHSSLFTHFKQGSTFHWYSKSGAWNEMKKKMLLMIGTHCQAEFKHEKHTEFRYMFIILRLNSSRL